MQTLANRTQSPFVSLRDAMDQLVQSAFTTPPAGAGWGTQWSRGMGTWPVNVFEDGEAYYVYALIAGVNPEELQITAQPGGYLTIAGEIKPQFPEKASALWAEFGQQQFRRDVQLPASFEPDGAQVEYHDGVLRIVLPKAPQARARQIKVLTNGNGKTTGK